MVSVLALPAFRSSLNKWLINLGITLCMDSAGLSHMSCLEIHKAGLTHLQLELCVSSLNWIISTLMMIKYYFEMYLTGSFCPCKIKQFFKFFKSYHLLLSGLSSHLCTTDANGWKNPIFQERELLVYISRTRDMLTYIKDFSKKKGNTEKKLVVGIGNATFIQYFIWATLTWNIQAFSKNPVSEHLGVDVETLMVSL